MDTIILLSNTGLAHANFFKDGSRCQIAIFGDDDHPVNYLSRFSCTNKLGDNGFLYHVTPKSGNMFYKRLIARGWVRN